jgi:hypothetical protein
MTFEAADTIKENSDDEKPLDPAIEALRQRLVRLMAVSIGIMMVGLFAVLGAIVYKTYSGTSRIAATDGTIAIPAGMKVLDQSLDGDRLALRLQGADGAQIIMLFSLMDGSPAGQWAIVPDIKTGQ